MNFGYIKPIAFLPPDLKDTLNFLILFHKKDVSTPNVLLYYTYSIYTRPILSVPYTLPIFIPPKWMLKNLLVLLDIITHDN